MPKRKKPLPYFEKVTITDAGSEGKAVGRTGEAVVFVPYVVPGDVVDVQAIKKKTSFYEGRAVRFHQYSDKRTEPRCVHFGLCGGCRWQNMAYEHQLYFKEKQVRDNFQRIGKLKLDKMRPILPSENIFHYRNKLDFTYSNKRWLVDKEEPVSSDKDMNGLGFHLPGMFDRILDLQECHLQPDPSNEIRMAARQYALDHDLSFYDARRNEGFLRNLILRNTHTGGWMAIQVFGHGDEEAIRDMMAFFRDRFPAITSLHYVINTKVNDDISDLPIVHFHGDPHITEEFPPWHAGHAPLKFRISPVSFFQTNPVQAERLYRTAADLAGFRGDELVYDLYAGTGTIAIYVAPFVRNVVGIEYIPAAIEDAKENASLNGIANTCFFAGDIARIMDDAFIEENGSPDVIITDPPRAGMHEKVVRKILDIAPEKVVYISCNPATQARDLALLTEKYTIEAIQPVDMFPHTQHIENITLLHRKNLG